MSGRWRPKAQEIYLTIMKCPLDGFNLVVDFEPKSCIVNSKGLSSVYHRNCLSQSIDFIARH